MIRRAVVLCIGFIFWVIPSVAQNEVDNFQLVRDIVQKFLEGKSDVEVLMIVSDSIFSEKRPSKLELQKIYKDCDISFFKMVISAEENSAVITLKTTSVTKDVRLHTFALLKDKDGVWRISCWHSSH